MSSMFVQANVGTSSVCTLFRPQLVAIVSLAVVWTNEQIRFIGKSYQ